MNETKVREEELAEIIFAEEGLLSAMLEELPLGIVLFNKKREIVYHNRKIVSLLGGEIAWRKTRLSDYAFRDEAVHEMAVFIPEKRTLQITVRHIGENRMILAEDNTDLSKWKESRRSFVVNASHELKGPAAAILAIGETMETVPDLPEPAKRFSVKLVAEARRLSSLVLDLLDLSRLEQEERQRKERVDIAGLINDSLDYWQKAATEAGIELKASIAGTQQIKGNQDDLRLLINNLLDNAIRYNREKGTIFLDLEDTGEEIRISLQDTGIGIPKKHLPHIFERFYRVDRSRSRETGGTGIGLSIVKHIVESHGGSIEVQSSLGEGSVFIVRLPVD